MGIQWRYLTCLPYIVNVEKGNLVRCSTFKDEKILSKQYLYGCRNERYEILNDP